MRIHEQKQHNENGKCFIYGKLYWFVSLTAATANQVGALLQIGLAAGVGFFVVARAFRPVAVGFAADFHVDS